MPDRERSVTLQVAPLAEAARLNREYWAAVPAEQRLAQVWDLVSQYVAWRTPDAGESRLQRSVLSIKRRGPQDVVDADRLAEG